MSKELSHDLLKKLFIQKMWAIEKCIYYHLNKEGQITSFVIAINVSLWVSTFVGIRVRLRNM